jgi:hypothetical protein
MKYFAALAWAWRPRDCFAIKAVFKIANTTDQNTDCPTLRCTRARTRPPSRRWFATRFDACFCSRRDSAGFLLFGCQLPLSRTSSQTPCVVFLIRAKSTCKYVEGLPCDRSTWVSHSVTASQHTRIECL